MTFCLLQPQLFASLVQLFFLSLARGWLREVLAELVGAQVILVDDRELLFADEGVVFIESCLFSNGYRSVTLLEQNAILRRLLRDQNLPGFIRLYCLFAQVHSQMLIL